MSHIHHDALSKLVKRLIVLTGIACLIGCSSGPVIDASSPNRIAHSIELEDIDNPLRLVVTLPDGYDAGRPSGYPMLFHVAFDGDSDQWTQSVVQSLMDENSIPDIIVVSFDGSTTNDAQFSPRGDQDSNGSGAANFLDQIEEAVIPLLANEYNVGDDLILAGWSRFGVFTSYALSHNPDFFSGYIIRSSAPDDSFLHPAISDALSGISTTKTVVHVSIGTEGNEVSRRDSFDKFLQLLSNSNSSNLRWQADVVDGAGHIQTFQPGLRSGLKFYFDDSQTESEPDAG